MENSRPTGPMGPPEPTPQSTDISSPAAQGHSAQSLSWLLALGALGVVFGDIGTSPLYALHTAFSMEHNAVTIAPENVYGIISMVLWTITLIVTIKYVSLVMRADNEGQGGILALVALLRTHLANRKKLGTAVTVLGMLGAALFYGDAIITPAISVLSAAEGLSVVSPRVGGLGGAGGCGGAGGTFPHPALWNRPGG